MSRKEVIMYKRLSMELTTKCDNALSALRQIDNVIESINNNELNKNNKLLNKYAKYLQKTKKSLINKIEHTKQQIQQARTKRNEDYIAQYKRDSIINKTNELAKAVSKLTTAEFYVVRQMINNNLISDEQKPKQETPNLSSLAIAAKQILVDKIKQIDDFAIRELAFNQLSKNIVPYDEIIKNATSEYNTLLNKSSFAQDIANKLKFFCVDQEKIDYILSQELNINTIEAINEMVNNVINDVMLKNKTLKAIIEAIKARGFVVDMQNDFKIDHKTNIAKLIAKKPSGQIAEFEISLNGKLMYHFDNYQGQTCQNDIKPFLNDLENIYGIDIVNREVI